MQIVIEIAEKTYNEICKYGLYLSPNSYKNLEQALKNGTPLPKGHGRLIDGDALIHWHRFESKSDYDIANAPTIIEADTESEGEE